uniref:Ig-like domain-containing protein n=1 Tax=Glossina austeni TaxID=7395 RepID=A0A1A9UMS2_GLOAU
MVVTLKRDMALGLNCSNKQRIERAVKLSLLLTVLRAHSGGLFSSRLPEILGDTVKKPNQSHYCRALRFYEFIRVRRLRRSSQAECMAIGCRLLQRLFDEIPLRANRRSIDKTPSASPELYANVVNSKRETDAGVYWCEAKNELGVARSRNATLQVAVRLGDTIFCECRVCY